MTGFTLPIACTHTPIVKDISQSTAVEFHFYPSHGNPMKKTLLAVLVAASTQALAVSSFEYNSGIQFNFSNPGARSLGMGGAYLGFSDDATAAYTNPAGLTVLSQPEVAVEYRASRFSTPFVAGGDSIGAFERESSSRTSGPAYFAAVYPGDGWALAFYRNEELDFRNEFEKGTVPIRFNNLTGNIASAISSVEAETVNYGLSGAYELSDNFSVGISAIYTMFDFAAATVRDREDGSFSLQDENSDEETYTFNVGATYKVDDKLSFGLAYRRGAEFDTVVRAARLRDNGSLSDIETRRGAFNIPHQIGLGVAYRATDNFAVGFDAHYVDYETLNDDPLREELDSRVFFDSVVELRLGAEYVFSQFDTPFTVRAGVWRDPDHRFQFQGTPTNGNQAADQVLFPAGDDEIHYSLGFGWAFERLQIDAGADFSDPVKTFSVSGVLRF
jgi:long-chain fatty acid transport protein